MINSNEHYRVGHKLHALLLIAKGFTSRQVEEIYKISFSQITQWVHQLEQGGLDSLYTKPGQGRKSRLDDAQRQRLGELVLKENHEDHGYNTATWTGPLLIDWIKKHFGVEYKKAQIYNIMTDLGLSHQKAKARFPEADSQKQETFQDELKKTDVGKG